MIVPIVILGLALTATEPPALAYLALTDGYWQVWVMSADGSGPLQVTRSVGDKMRASWYPDGRHLFVNGSDGRVYGVAIGSDKETPISCRLQGFQDAVLAPNGRTFTFSFSMSGSVDDHDIWIAEIDGCAPRKLTAMPWLQHEPAWSPDGQWIYFLSGSGGQAHDIWRVNVASQQTQQLSANALYHFDVAAAPDGRLAYSSNRTGSYDIWLRSSTGEERQITNDAALDAHPSWSPDAKSLVFESSVDGSFGIWRVDLPSGTRMRLTSADIPSRYPVWRVAGPSP